MDITLTVGAALLLVQEANRRGFRTRRGGSQTIERPETLTAADIGYYTNPLQRLVGLHSGFTELMTGLSYVPPWQRDDARFR